MGAKPHILVLNGPNLNMLGLREPATYGSSTLADVEDMCVHLARDLGLEVTCKQSNNEGDLVSWIQEAWLQKAAGLIINAGAYTHSSIALYDALKMTGLPAIEVHISNVFAREPMRHVSLLSPVVSGVICGCGVEGYALALRRLASLTAPSQGKEHEQI